MRSSSVIGLDVGGTNIDGAVVSVEGKIIGEVRSIPSISGQDFETGIQNLIKFIKNILTNADNEVTGCCLGMPNPFDYTSGVSHMEHKFQDFYGKDMRGPLESALGLPFYFVNDGDAFALGAYWNHTQHVRKLVGITLGTGIGAGFIDSGQIITSGGSAPPGGEVWNLPFRGGILEDFVSARAIISLYENAEGRPLSPKEIANLAREGDAAARLAYQKMGRALGEGLAMACEKFQPDVIVIGGKMAQASDLFLSDASDAYHSLASSKAVLHPAEHDWLAILGCARYAFDAS